MNQVMAQVVHGAPDYEELERLGLSLESICDLSVNSNPYGPSLQVQDALAHVPIERYPDRACLHVRRAIQTYELGGMALSLDSILCGNGTAELIWSIARAFLHTGSKAAIIGPTFGEYCAASLAAGAAVVEYRSQAAEQFHLDEEAVIAWIEHQSPTLLWLCNPNNPTGAWLNPQALSSMLEVCQRTETVLVIDEAYWRFLVPQEPFSAVELVRCLAGVPLLVLRSLTKEYALSGARLGYAVAAPEVIERVRRQLPSWNVNAFAQAAGVAAIRDRVHLTRTLHDLAAERLAFFRTLEAFGLDVVPSRTHFCLIYVGDANSIRQQLLSRGILVRDCTSFGLPQYIRVATRQRSEWQSFVNALGVIL
jgi:histidinol-phosphate aminotransferase